MARGRGGNPVRAGSLGDREALLVVDRGQGELQIERHQAGGPESGELVARIEPDPGGERVAEVFLVDASGWLLTTRLPGGGEARLGDGSGRIVWSFRSPEPAFGAAAGAGNGRVEPLAFGSSGALLATGRELILVARDGTREARFLRPPDLEPLRVRATPEGFELAGDGRVYRFP